MSGDLYLRPIDSGDVLKKFSLGSKDAAPLKTFLTKDAKAYHDKNVAKTFVLVADHDNPEVQGYLTLVCSEISNQDSTRLDDCERANSYGTFPAVKLVRLAVHKDVQGQGYGAAMLEWCLSHVVTNIMPNAGCRFLVVDAKPSAANFYEKTGFTRLQSQSDKTPHPILFIDLHKLQCAS